MRDRERERRAQQRTDEVIGLLSAGLVRVASAHSLTPTGGVDDPPDSAEASLDLPADLPLSVPAGERSRSARETTGGSTR